jgi:hypothetical protein
MQGGGGLVQLPRARMGGVLQCVTPGWSCLSRPDLGFPVIGPGQPICPEGLGRRSPWARSLSSSIFKGHGRCSGHPEAGQSSSDLLSIVPFPRPTSLPPALCAPRSEAASLTQL